METVTDFIFLGSKITGDHEIKRHLLSLEENLWQTYSVLKSRDNTLPKTICIVKATVFPVVCMDVRVGP